MAYASWRFRPTSRKSGSYYLNTLWAPVLEKHGDQYRQGEEAQEGAGDHHTGDEARCGCACEVRHEYTSDEPHDEGSTQTQPTLTDHPPLQLKLQDQQHNRNGCLAQHVYGFGQERWQRNASCPQEQGYDNGPHNRQLQYLLEGCQSSVVTPRRDTPPSDQPRMDWVAKMITATASACSPKASRTTGSPMFPALGKAGSWPAAYRVTELLYLARPPTPA